MDNPKIRPAHAGEEDEPKGVVEKSKPGGGNIWCLPKESAILC
jgi:hypothetical protein